MTLEPITAPPSLFIYLSEGQQEAINGGHSCQACDVEEIDLSVMSADPEKQAQDYAQKVRDFEDGLLQLVATLQ